MRNRQDDWDERLRMRRTTTGFQCDKALVTIQAHTDVAETDVAETDVAETDVAETDAAEMVTYLAFGDILILFHTVQQ